jgi:3-oxoadipate enol-lactonase
MAFIAEESANQLLGPATDPAMRALLIEAMGALSPRSYGAAVQCVVGFDEHANLGHIEVPVLCLVDAEGARAPK